VFPDQHDLAGVVRVVRDQGLHSAEKGLLEPVRRLLQAG
jgi:hypothetical protein